MTVEPEYFPSSGIWYVRNYPGSRSSTLITKKLRDLPKAVKLAALWPFKELLTRWVCDFWEEARNHPKYKNGYSASDMAGFITSKMAKHIRQESEDEFVANLKGITQDDRDPV